jgi:hypothetical protein
MKQVFYPYWMWEDYKNGMYDASTENQDELVFLAQSLLTAPSDFYKAIQDVFTLWPISSSVNMTNINCNRRAWLGQSACCLKFRTNEILTRQAWKYMTESERIEANKIADICIKEYENTLRNGKEKDMRQAFQTRLQLG